MSGIRVGHEMLSENVIEIKIQYAEQTFRGHQRELSMLDIIGDREPEVGSELHKELTDWAHRTGWRHPLVE